MLIVQARQVEESIILAAKAIEVALTVPVESVADVWKFPAGVLVWEV